MNLAYLFEYRDKAYQPLEPVKGFSGPLPSQDNIVLFQGPEASLLQAAGLPASVWRVRQLAYDIALGEVKTVTLSLETRNQKSERELASQR